MSDTSISAYAASTYIVSKYTATMYTLTETYHVAHLETASSYSGVQLVCREIGRTSARLDDISRSMYISVHVVN